MSELDRKRQERLSKTTPQSKLRSEAVMSGVSAGWLAEVFGMTVPTVRKRLRECPVKDWVKQGARYDLATAAAFLVKPKFDVHAFLKTMKPTELPQNLQSEYWEMMRTRRKYELETGDLWHTDEVQEVLSQVFMTIKSTCQLWPDELERSSGLSDTQRETLIKYVDGLLSDIRSSLLDAKIGSEVKPVKTETELEADFLRDEGEDDIGKDLI